MGQAERWDLWGLNFCTPVATWLRRASHGGSKAIYKKTPAYRRRRRKKESRGTFNTSLIIGLFLSEVKKIILLLCEII
jgi:hypothetical protein